MNQNRKMEQDILELFKKACRLDENQVAEHLLAALEELDRTENVSPEGSVSEAYRSIDMLSHKGKH